MPDVTTHLLFGVSAALILCRKRSREEAMLLVLGSVAVDSERPLSLLLTYLGYTHDFTAAFHSLLGIVVVSYAAATTFHIDHADFGTRFRLIHLGTVIHILLDLTMHPWPECGLYLLYPLKIPYSFGLVWSDYPYFPLFGLVALAIALLLRTVLDRLDPASDTSTSADTPPNPQLHRPLHDHTSSASTSRNRPQPQLQSPLPTPTPTPIPRTPTEINLVRPLWQQSETRLLSTTILCSTLPLPGVAAIPSRHPGQARALTVIIRTRSFQQPRLLTPVVPRHITPATARFPTAFATARKSSPIQALSPPPERPKRAR